MSVNQSANEKEDKIHTKLRFLFFFFYIFFYNTRHEAKCGTREIRRKFGDTAA